MNIDKQKKVTVYDYIVASFREITKNGSCKVIKSKGTETVKCCQKVVEGASKLCFSQREVEILIAKYGRKEVFKYLQELEINARGWVNNNIGFSSQRNS